MRSSGQRRRSLSPFVVVLWAFCFAAGQGIAIAKKQPPAKPIDINSAGAKELEQLPGVGPTTASAIILFRVQSGPFRRVEDLLAVRGISEAKLNAMRPYITIHPQLATPTPPRKSP